MWYKRLFHLWLIALSILLHSCNNGNSAKNAENGFYQQIDNSFSNIKIEDKGYVKQAVGVVPNQLIFDSDHGYLIVASRANNSIMLYDGAGGTLLSATGREGKGPGEFNAISQLHIGYDHALYVLDSTLKRITKYKIENQQLQYVTIFTPKANLNIRDIYVTKYGNFGVLHRIDDYKTWDESFHLYRLDNEFSPVKPLQELPGNQKLKISEHMYIDHLLGRITYWDLEDEWFYYISSKSSEINMYNLKTGQLKTQQYFTLENRANTEETKKFFKTHFASLSEGRPTVTEAIQETDLLPMFSNFIVDGDRILFSVFHAGEKGGRIILANQTTGDVEYLRIPTVIRRFALGEGVLYGIISTENDGPKIRIWEFNSSS